jgi:hypothetical protein
MDFGCGCCIVVASEVHRDHSTIGLCPAAKTSGLDHHRLSGMSCWHSICYVARSYFRAGEPDCVLGHGYGTQVLACLQAYTHQYVLLKVVSFCAIHGLPFGGLRLRGGLLL